MSEETFCTRTITFIKIMIADLVLTLLTMLFFYFLYMKLAEQTAIDNGYENYREMYCNPLKVNKRFY